MEKAKKGSKKGLLIKGKRKVVLFEPEPVAETQGGSKAAFRRRREEISFLQRVIWGLFQASTMRTPFCLKTPLKGAN